MDALQNYLDDQARVTHWPSKLKYKLAVLDYLATFFDPGRTYSESEVNGIIAAKHAFEDNETLRREMIGRKKLARTTDCRAYWKV